jgi:peroxiredoxin
MLKLVIGLLLAASIFFAGFILVNQRDRIPELVLLDSKGKSASLEDIRSGRENLLLVFVLPRCPISRASLAQVSQLLRIYSDRIAFAGLFFGSRQQAREFQARQSLAFPLFSLKDAPDPFAVNELYEEIGFSKGTRKAIYGGTVLLVDPERYVLFKLEKEEIRELPERLADLGY